MKGFLGIDVGTQGLSVVFVDEEMNVVATGDGRYEMVAGLSDGCYEQIPHDWEAALRNAMVDLNGRLRSIDVDDCETLAIGITGQMHGEVLVDENNNVIGTSRLWCDSRNEAEGTELTELLGVKMPKRITAARWLWTVRSSPDKAKKVKRISTPAGWLAFRLTGQWNLGIGDASGMFPIDQSTFNYDQEFLRKFDMLIPDGSDQFIELLPVVKRAGEDGGGLTVEGSEILGLEPGIPVAPAEGDQPAAMAGSLIGEAGMVAVSFGTSVCANSVGDRVFAGVHDAVDHFCAVDGKPINMVFLRNGTTFMNTIVEMFAGNSGQDFSSLMQQVLETEPTCGGIMALPFMDDEPGLGINRGGLASLVGINQSNVTAANCIRAALTATMFNLKSGLKILDEQGFPRAEIVLTGGLTKTSELGQILADIIETPVVLPNRSDEGTAIGAALLARQRFETVNGSKKSWAEFLTSCCDSTGKKFVPSESANISYEPMFNRYMELVSQIR